jgi:pseudouridine-5'-phosphate glycosidase
MFPAFFTNDSGIRPPLNISSPREIAAMVVAQENLNLKNGRNTWPNLNHTPLKIVVHFPFLPLSFSE